MQRRATYEDLMQVPDPLVRTLEVYRLEGERWLVASTHGGDDVVRAEPFDAIDLALERWSLAPG